MSATQRGTDLSVVVTSLLRGVVYREANEGLWRDLLACRAQTRDAVDLLGLRVVIDESEGYAYLRQVPDDERDERIPRLIPRRELPFDVSLTLALLRRRLAHSDVEGGDSRLVVTRQEIGDLLRVFLEQSATETRVVERTDALVRRVCDLGFLRPVRQGNDGSDRAGDLYEVRRVLKAFVDGQWLADFDARLAAYLDHVGE